MTLPIRWIATHKRTDFDEIFAIFMLWELPEAEKLFPGVNNARVVFWDAGRKTPDGRFADEKWVRKNRTLPVGCGGGPFDEHPHPGEPRSEEQECAATLVAREIGVENKPELQSLLAFARRVNNTATADPSDISSIIKLMHQNGDMLVEDIFEWAEWGIHAKYCEDPASPEKDNFKIDHLARLLREQNPDQLAEVADWLEQGQFAQARDDELFHTVTAEEYQKKKVIIEFTGWNGKKKETQRMKILVIESNDPRIHRYARSAYGDKVAVTIQKRTSGNVVIMSNKYYGLKLRDVAQMVKLEEPPRQGEEPYGDWKELRDELMHGVWYYFVPGESLFNGSHTSPETPPTKQDLLRIVELVKIALSVNEFEPFRQEKCRQGICTSSRESPCSWYHWGMARCQTIRVHQRENSGTTRKQVG